MIDPALLFQLTGYLTIAGWAALLISLFVRETRPIIWPATQYVIPAIFCICYVLMVWQGRGGLNIPDSFSSLEKIRTLYQDNSALTAGWLHFLALDMFVGTWIVRDGLGRGVPVLLILLCLPFTLMLGPSGLLLYLVLRLLINHRDGPETP